MQNPKTCIFTNSNPTQTSDRNHHRPCTPQPMQQHPRERRSRIRRGLRNLTSLLRPMPRHLGNPPPGNPSETNLEPLPQPPPTPVATKHVRHVPLHHDVPDTTTPTHFLQQHSHPSHHVDFHHPQPHFFQNIHHPHHHTAPSFPHLQEDPARRLRLPQTHIPLPSMQNHSREYVPQQLHTPSIHSEHPLHSQNLRINPPQPRTQSYPMRITPSQPHTQPRPLRINPSQPRVQPHPMRPHEFPRTSPHDSHPVLRSLPRQSFHVGDLPERMAVEMPRRAASSLQPPQHPSANFSVRGFPQSHRGPERMDIDSSPPGSIGMRNVHNMLSTSMQRTQHPPGVMPPSYPFMNDLPRQYSSQHSLPVSNLSFPSAETISQPRSSQFPDSLLQSSIPPHQLARLYERLQRSTTTTRTSPPSTPKPVQSGKSRRGQRQRAQKSPRSRPSRMLKSDHILRMLTLSQAPSHWFGSLEISNTINGTADTATVPVGAFLYTLANKPAFTATLPDSIKLSTDTAQEFDRDVVNAATEGQFMIRVSPVNDYGHTVGNATYADFINSCMGDSIIHRVQIHQGSLLLFPVTFPQVGLALVGIFVAN